MWRRRRGDNEFSDEIRSHIELETEQGIAEGLSPEEARIAAVRRFGNVAAVQERFHERHGVFFEQIWQDVRYAGRTLAKTPTFTIVAILTMALGIGANTAIFSVIKPVLLDPLPYPHSDRLVQIVQTTPASMSIDAVAHRSTAMDMGEFFEVRKHTQTLASLSAYESQSEFTLIQDGATTRVIGTGVSSSLFATLNVQPLFGHFFGPEEESVPTRHSIVLSYGAWQKYFGSDRNVIDRAVMLDGHQYRVAAVMGPGFAFPDTKTEIWLPMDLSAIPGGQIRDCIPLARLKDGTSTSAVSEEISAVITQVRASYPTDRVRPPVSLEVVGVKDELVRPVRSALLVMMIAVMFVLWIACSNVASLLLARGAARESEYAVRSALGAGRGRLVRQMLTESLLIGLLGGLGGIVLAGAGVHVLASLAAGYLPRLITVGIDGGVLIFTVAVSVASSFIFGLFPAVQLSRSAPIESIKSGGSAKGSARFGAQAPILVAETAVAIVLMVSAGLLVRSFVKLTEVNPGFDPNQVVTFQVALPQPVNPSLLTDELTQEFLRRLQTLPGVRNVAYSNALPMVQRGGYSQPRITGTPIAMEGMPQFREVTPNYFSALGLHVMKGRDFSMNDGRGQPLVVVINQAMAHYFGSEDPLGRALTLGKDTSTTIIGVVNDIHEQALNVPARPEVYIDSRQSLYAFQSDARALNWAYFMVRSERPPVSIIPDIRSMVSQMVPGATLTLNAAGMEDLISGTIAQPRLYAVLLGVFGGIAVLLALIGVYGVTSFWASQRVVEFGIRIALGATQRNVLATVVRATASIAAAGILIGIAVASLVSGYLKTLLFGLTPLDPMTFVTVPIIFALTTLIAALIPALRAARIDPLSVLRRE